MRLHIQGFLTPYVCLFRKCRVSISKAAYKRKNINILKKSLYNYGGNAVCQFYFQFFHIIP